MILKLSADNFGEHVHVKFFMGPDLDHLANCGKLTLRIGEWQLLGACLLLGAERMTVEHLEVVPVGYLAGDIVPIGHLAKLEREEEDDGEAETET